MRSPAVAAGLFAVLATLLTGAPALAARGDCGQPVTGGDAPQASDALAILRAAVSASPACPLPAPGRFPVCRCDVNGSGGITSGDALVVLRVAVGTGSLPGCKCPVAACGSDSCVFVTEPIGNGNAGGLAGSDALCNEAAANAGLGGNYRAWRSQNSPRIDARDHLEEAGPWRLVNGALVAVDKADLTDGTIASPIDMLPTGSTEWFPWGPTTGTNPDGTLAKGDGTSIAEDVTCSNWTDSGPDITKSAALLGSVNSTDDAWTYAFGWLWCDSPQRLFCFEVGLPMRCTFQGLPVSQDRCRNAAQCPASTCVKPNFLPGVCSLVPFPCNSNADCAVTCQ